MDYATISDLENLWRTMTETEKTKAEQLISEASSRIRLKAKAQGKNFDDLYTADEDIKAVVTGLVCTVVKNAMNVSTDNEAMTQESQSAGGYTWSGTFFNPSGGIKFTKADWKSIGLGQQTFGGLDIYGTKDTRH